MRALVYHGPLDIRCDTVADPDPAHVDGAVVKITKSGICGSDLHIYEGHGWAAPGYSTGHEAVGEVVEVGSEVHRFKTGDRVLISGAAACVQCQPCAQGRMDLCESGLASVFGIGIGLQGSQAEAAAVPGADNTLARIPEGMSDEQALMLTDNLPTGWFGAARAEVRPGSTVGVVGLGPVGQHAVESSFVMGASRVLAFDRVPERLEAAASVGAEPISVDEHTVERVLEITGGRGVDAAIEAVGVDATIQLALQIAGRSATIAVVGIPQSENVLVPGMMTQGKNQTVRLCLCPVQSTWPALLPLVQQGRLHPERVITTRMALSDGANAYARFLAREDGVMKVVLDA